MCAAGLYWEVIQKSIQTVDGIEVAGFKANVISTDNQVLGVVSNRYSVVNNHEAFAFTDELLGEGVRYETASSLQNGRKVWLLAKLPDHYIVAGDRITPYLVFANSHDGSRSIKVAMTPHRSGSFAKRILISSRRSSCKGTKDQKLQTEGISSAINDI